MVGYDWLNGNSGFVGEVFRALTDCTAFDVILDESGHARPPEVALNEFGGFVATGVTRNFRVVIGAEDVLPECELVWDEYFAFVEG